MLKNRIQGSRRTRSTRPTALWVLPEPGGGAVPFDRPSAQNRPFGSEVGRSK